MDEENYAHKKLNIGTPTNTRNISSITQQKQSLNKAPEHITQFKGERFKAVDWSGSIDSVGNTIGQNNAIARNNKLSMQETSFNNNIFNQAKARTLARNQRDLKEQHYDFEHGVTAQNLSANANNGLNNMSSMMRGFTGINAFDDKGNRLTPEAMIDRQKNWTDPTKAQHDMMTEDEYDTAYKNQFDKSLSALTLSMKSNGSSKFAIAAARKKAMSLWSKKRDGYLSDRKSTIAKYQGDKDKKDAKAIKRADEIYQDKRSHIKKLESDKEKYKIRDEGFFDWGKAQKDDDDKVTVIDSIISRLNGNNKKGKEDNPK